LMTLLVLAALGLVAFLYASVGHAGASGYLAVLALAGFSGSVIKPIALILNVAVASVGAWQFIRAGYLRWRTFWPLVVLSVPAAYLGGSLILPTLWFNRLVGLVLVVSSIRLLRDPHDAQSLREPNISVLLLTGGGLGLLAGLTGTGGGVFLTPLLLFRRWCTTKQAAACSVMFILLNSLAGLAGYVIARGGLLAGALDPLVPMMALSVPVVFAAGALGARFGSHHWPGTLLRRLLAIVLLLAATKLLSMHI
jgi:uncharacterized membrane protein YfcA